MALNRLACCVAGLLIIGAPCKSRGQGHKGLSEGSEEIHFQLIFGYIVVVRGDVEPLTSLNFVVDTGTSTTVLNSSIASQLGIALKVDQVLSIEGEQNARSGVIPEIHLGPLREKNVPAMAIDLHSLEDSLKMPIAGIVGLNLLRRHNFVIDFSHKRIEFDPKKEMRRRHEVPFEKLESALLIGVTIEGTKFDLMVDTGAPQIILFAGKIPTAFLDTMERLSGPQPSLKFQDGGLGTASYRARLAGLERWPLGPQNVLVVDGKDHRRVSGEMDGLFSVCTMGFRRVGFDFQAGKFSWE